MVMQDSDKNNFKELMTGIGELYSKEITKPLLRIYFTAFSKLTIEQVNDAVAGHITDTSTAGTFFPKPADIIRQITGTDKQRSESTSNKAELAWASIEGQVSSIGSYQSPKIDDRQAMAALKAMGGWIQLCASTVEQLTWKKKEFVDIYKTFEQTPVEMLPNNMPGRIELEQHKGDEANQMNGLMKQLEARGK